MNDFEPSPTPLLRSIDLNADLGEGAGNDRALLDLISSASICCGAHAGGIPAISNVLQHVKPLGIIVGAHPGYADRASFGRKEQSLPRSQLIASLNAQLDTLDRYSRNAGMSIRYLKPHGALYNQAQRDAEIAAAVLTVASQWRLPLLGQPGTLLETLASERNHTYIAEGFPDRRYRADGSLVPRSEPDAIIEDSGEFETQVLRLVADPRIHTLCIHGDDPKAVRNATRLRQVLLDHRIAIRPFMATVN